MKYLLIDGNNLAIRSAFANESLTSSSGVPTGVHYGVFHSLITLKSRFPEHKFLMVWDGKSKRRKEESEQGVQDNLIPSSYKSNRKKDDLPRPLQEFHEQQVYLQRGIFQTGIPQIRLSDYEADDVIASYVEKLKSNHEVLIVTSDKDYWQLLDDNVSLWDGMKSTKTTKESWSKEYGLNPLQAIDIGALCGDNGDNIFGIPGWGEKTAIKEIQKHGSWEKVISGLEKKFKALKKEFPDIKDIVNGKINLKTTSFFNTITDNEDLENKFNNLMEETSGTKIIRKKYPDVNINTPYSGVILALHLGMAKVKKTDLMAVAFKERVRLAYSLKKMDKDIELPEIKNVESNKEKLMEYFEYFDIKSLQEGIDVLFEEDCEKESVALKDMENEEDIISIA